jgi:hypothetical protein
MTDDNIIGIDGRQAAQRRTDQAEREKLCRPERQLSHQMNDGRTA